MGFARHGAMVPAAVTFWHHCNRFLGMIQSSVHRKGLFAGLPLGNASPSWLRRTIGPCALGKKNSSSCQCLCIHRCLHRSGSLVLVHYTYLIAAEAKRVCLKIFIKSG